MNYALCKKKLFLFSVQNSLLINFIELQIYCDFWLVTDNSVTYHSIHQDRVCVFTITPEYILFINLNCMGNQIHEEMFSLFAHIKVACSFNKQGQLCSFLKQQFSGPAFCQRTDFPILGWTYHSDCAARKLFSYMHYVWSELSACNLWLLHFNAYLIKLPTFILQIDCVNFVCFGSLEKSHGNADIPRDLNCKTFHLRGETF